MASEQNISHISKAQSSKTTKGKGKAIDDSNEQGIKKKAVWDSKSHAIFVKHCKELVRAGYRPSTHFTKDGWNLLVKRFNEVAKKKL